MTTDNHGILEKGGGLLWVSDDGLKFNTEPLSGFHNYQDLHLHHLQLQRIHLVANTAMEN